MQQPISIGWYGPVDSCWSWVTQHFSDCVALRPHDLEALITGNHSHSADTAKRSVVLLCSDSRFDVEVMKFAHQLEESNSQEPSQSIKWCMLLGDDWVGHRRTNPLPDEWPIYYWYELYDRILPWAMELISTTSQRALQSNPSARKNNPRVQRWLDASQSIRGIARGTDKPFQLGLVISETEATRDLWTQSLAGHGIRCVGATPLELYLWMDPDLIVVDLEAEPVALCMGIQDRDDVLSCGVTSLVRQLKTQFPNAVQIVMNSFPRWQTWQSLQASGADIVLAKPAFFDGAMHTLTHLRG